MGTNFILHAVFLPFFFVLLNTFDDFLRFIIDNVISSLFYSIINTFQGHLHLLSKGIVSIGHLFIGFCLLNSFLMFHFSDFTLLFEIALYFLYLGFQFLLRLLNQSFGL